MYGFISKITKPIMLLFITFVYIYIYIYLQLVYEICVFGSQPRSVFRGQL